MVSTALLRYVILYNALNRRNGINGYRPSPWRGLCPHLPESLFTGCRFGERIQVWLFAMATDRDTGCSSQLWEDSSSDMIRAWCRGSSQWSPLELDFLEYTPTVASKDGLCRHYSSVCVPNLISCFRTEDSLHSIAAWFGSLINGPIADRLGRKLSMNVAVVIFVIGSAIQCGAVNIPMLFVGTWHAHIEPSTILKPA